MSRIACLVPALLLVAAAPLAAQEWDIAPGQRMKVSSRPSAVYAGAKGATWEGILRYVTPDSIVIDPVGGMDALALPWSSVAEVRRFAGRGNSAGKGALIGGLSLGAIGMAGDIACAGEEVLGCPPFGVGTLAMGAVGAGLGALIGLAVPRERWARVEQPSWEVTPTVLEGRPGVAVHLRF